MTRGLKKYCINCGDPFRGVGELCKDCVPPDTPTRPLPPDQHRCLGCGLPIPIAGDFCPTCQLGREARGLHPQKSRTDVPTSGICPWCRKEITWTDILRAEHRLPDNVVETIYYCPHCRSTLEFANYIEEKGTNSRP